MKSYLAGNNILSPAQYDSTAWRIWSERMSGGKRMVAIAFARPGLFKTYMIETDSARHVLTLHPSGSGDTASLHFSYINKDGLNWQLKGLAAQKDVSIDLMRVRPDTVLPLLKTKRNIIIFDDESDSQ